jgi:hypothetical protein
MQSLILDCVMSVYQILKLYLITDAYFRPGVKTDAIAHSNYNVVKVSNLICCAINFLTDCIYLHPFYRSLAMENMLNEEGTSGEP